MELFFETRRDIHRINGVAKAVMQKPEVMPEPVLEPDLPCEEAGVSLYGSVIRDQGMFRMWYQSWPKEGGDSDAGYVGYAESDDGLSWRKPILNEVEFRGSRENNLCSLGMHAPSVVVDPTAPPEKRYRATGCFKPGLECSDSIRGLDRGYYAAVSSDGIHWELDEHALIWPESDVITSVWHPGRQRFVAYLKRTPVFNGDRRRSVSESTLEVDGWSKPVDILIPDEADDVKALMRGYKIADYYGMGTLPAGQGTAGFLWKFYRHNLFHGDLDVTLCFQEEAGSIWQHTYGREPFIERGSTSWNQAALYTASSPIEVGDEHWLYYNGTNLPHGYTREIDATGAFVSNPEKVEEALEMGYGRIGFVRWPKHRLFGLEFAGEGRITLNLGELKSDKFMVLNYETGRGGQIEVEIARRNRPLSGFDSANSETLTGSEISKRVNWNGVERVPVEPGVDTYVVLYVKNATLFAYDMIDV